MRPIAKPQSALEHPLNRILGTEANVRLLRALRAEGAPLTRAQLASAAGLSPVGARRALAALLETGVIESNGSARSGQYRLRERHPLFTALTKLFEAEARRVELLWARLVAAIEALAAPPISAWARAPETGSDALRIMILVGAAEVEPLRAAIGPSLAAIERELDVMLELVPLTRADLVAIPDQLRGIQLLHGPPPTALVRPPDAAPAEGRTKRTQRDADLEQLQSGGIVAAMIRADANLVPKAAAHVRRVIAKEARPSSDLREWLSILENNSASQIARLLESDSARGTRLRQTSIFVAVLSASQRKQLERALQKQRSRKGRR